MSGSGVWVFCCVPGPGVWVFRWISGSGVWESGLGCLGRVSVVFRSVFGSGVWVFGWVPGSGVWVVCWVSGSGASVFRWIFGSGVWVFGWVPGSGVWVFCWVPGSGAWVGIFLKSGRYISALKKLAITDFWKFKQEFDVYPRVDADGKPVPGGGTFKDAMPGDCNRAKLRAAWKAYASFKLKHLNQPWRRVYVRIPEGALVLSSMATFHFGARFPLVFSAKEVPEDLWHMRMHSYFGPKTIRNPGSCPDAGIVQNQAQESTVDIFSGLEDFDWLCPAQRFASDAGKL